ncbi:hypothetical protein CLTEP_19290 [Clostridium tepidiprofundi DSM 19306]|uniref:DUF445 family protein n=1 Tax=Clostridium tepidiprofundi DSM 19306 TaxID=1121338 RepID=A0A151B323_9CLOT|nr:DUF445 family protein [Clostridium tepidiprofundi]KYH34152.1 hypothetical protein CLTEP_19290 [Clostridium tepidiprofundi DSM 19306]
MKFLVAALIGAIIGYVTNWLAIKMLFRPYTEKRFLGIKIPFTPGLIPKETPRIAKSVGEAIGKHLLTKETIVDSLCSENMNKQLKMWVKRKVDSIYSSKITIDEKMKQLSSGKLDGLREHIDTKISDLLIKTIRKDDIKSKISNFIRNKANDVLSQNPNIILENENFISLKDKILAETQAYINSDNMNDTVSEFIMCKIENLKYSNVTIKEMLPESLIEVIKVNIYNNKSNIAYEIKNILKKERTETKIKEAISNIISSNLNPMIAMFVNPNSIYQKIIPSIDEMLDKEENQDEIAEISIDIVLKVLDNKLSDIISSIPEDIKNDNVKSIVRMIMSNIANEQIVSSIYKNIENKILENESVNELLYKMDIDLVKIIDDIVMKYINDYVDNALFEEKVKELVSNAINKIINMPIDELLSDDKEKITLIVSSVIEELYNKFIENEAADVVELLNISKIIEEKINGFDVTYAEQIIFEIASKELRAITLLGALLGCIMGILSPVINAIM